VDNYYRYQYPNSYDGRYNNYDSYLSDPNYYDPYNRDASYQYANSNIPGINDLDYYGDWQNVDGYGNAWRPRVASDWVPYQQGSWTNDYPYGPTWVSSEPWGYAPYHYGRWANVGNQWYWVPDAVNTTPAYAPALVAFVPLNGGNQIGWVPLGPGDSYAPRYYDNNWQPQYLTRANVVPAQLINYGVPGAVTVVPVDAWGRAIDPRSVRRIDPQTLASVRPTLDPLTLTPLRNAVIHSAWGRGKIDLPPGIAKKLNDTRVFVGTDPTESRFRKDLAKSMRVERVSDQAKNQKFQVNDQRQQVLQQADNGRKQEVDQGRKQDVAAGRKQETDRVSTEAARGNKGAQVQARQLDQQQRRDTRVQQKAPLLAPPQPQGQRVGNPARHQAQTQVSRPQMNQVQPQKPRQQIQQRQQVQQPQQVQQRQQTQPRQQTQQRQQVQRPQQPQTPQLNKHEAKPQSQGAPTQSQGAAPGAAKQERKQGPPAQPGAQGQGGGKGKGKKP
jgi:hypothetical protein